MSPLEDDIQRLGRLTLADKTDVPARLELARRVGERIVASTPLSFAPEAAPKIFDVFRYNGEDMMLEMRLSEMADWVDTFVIVESPITFTHRQKPLHFQESREAFARYRDKIVYVVVDDFPDFLSAPWAVEFWQRDCAIRALSGLCSPNDIILLSDVDEIVRRSAVQAFSGDLAGLMMDTFFLFLNRRRVRSEKSGATGAICRANLLAKHGMSYMRYGLARAPDAPRIRDAGWHFTSVATPQELGEKIKSYSHREHGGTHDAAYFEKKRVKAQANASPRWERCSLDELPRYIRDNADRLGDLLM